MHKWNRYKMIGLDMDFTNSQIEAIETFKWNHHCEEFKNRASGLGEVAKLSLIVGSTSIGATLEIHCQYCKQTIDITDVDTW